MPAIHSRQTKVQQNYIREVSICGFEARYPIVSDVGFVTMCAKQTTKSFLRVVRIINDENAGQMWIGRSILAPIPCIV